MIDFYQDVCGGKGVGIILCFCFLLVLLSFVLSSPLSIFK